MEQYNKLLLFLLLTFCVSIAKAQPSQYTPMTAAGYQMKRVKVDSTLHLPSFCGTPTLRGSTATEGAIAIDTCNNILYKWTNQVGWTSITSGGGGSQDLQSVLNEGNSSYNKDINLYGRSSANQIYLSGMDNYWMPFMALGDSIGGGVYTYTYPQATIEFQNKYQSQKLKQQDSIRATIYLPTQTIDATDTLATLSDVRGTIPNLQRVTDSGNTTTNDIQLINNADVILGSGGAVLLDNGSKLKEGTIDAGYGGSNGVALVCAVGYELKWEAGRLYVMNDGGTTIREVRYTFGYTPDNLDDIGKGFIVGSRWVLDDGDVYVCSDNTNDAAVWVLQNNNVTDITRTVGKDSIIFYKGSTRYAIKDSVGGSSQNGRFGNDTATVVMVKVHNDAGVTLTNGKVVALTTSGNNNEAPAVRLANNKGDSTSANTLGFVSGSIANQDTGWVILSGKIEKLNTSAFSNGDIIYLDSVSGNITNTKPVAPYHMVYLGVVVKANAGNGAIFVKAQNGYELDEIHDVLITSKLNNQVLAYSDTQKVWKNRNIYSIVDTTSLSSRINTKLNTSDSSTYYTKYRSDTSRTNIYSAIGGKQSTLTNPVTGTGTNNQIAYFNSTGSTISSLTTTTYPSLTELSYVKGTTSAVQTQIDNKFTTPTGWTDYFASSTIVGGTGAAGVINYIVMGKILFVQINIGVTSTATNFSFTLPYTNGTTPQYGIGRGTNNNTNQASVGFYMAASTNVVTLLYGTTNITTPNVWTAANGKSAQGFLILNIP